MRLGAMAGAFGWSHAAFANCDALLPAPAAMTDPARAVTPLDIVRLRDIGYTESELIGYPSPLAVSPDGRQVAFVISQADPATNSYCRGLVVLPLRSGASPRLVDRGGELITIIQPFRGLFRKTGAVDVVQPIWSPDGHWIAYLRRDHDVTQVWRARADGGGAASLTHSNVDVEALAWSRDGQRIIFASRPGIIAMRRQYEAEGSSGWRYDARFLPHVSNRPQLRASIPRQIFVADPGTGAISPATPADAAQLPRESTPGVPQPPVAIASDGRRAWTAHESASPVSPLRLRAMDQRGATITCRTHSCAGRIVGLWWRPGERELVFLHREGWNDGQMGLYRWRPGAGDPRRVLLTDDVLNGCTPAGAYLVCTRENSVTPRRIALVDPRTGAVQDLFDLNPEFARLRIGHVERLYWKNSFGLKAWGDLVLPPDWTPGHKLPLVVVQYHSDGFLRGGTGDDYPIFAFAAHGFAVLSFERPPDVADAFPNLKTFEEINAVDQKDWAERRSQLSAILIGVQQVIDRGIADPTRIGITGLSDGASSVRFALINSTMFAAAAISTCCVDPHTAMTYGGIAWADANRAIGWPQASADNRAFWQPYSLALNAARIDTPLLMQLADSEYLLALETFTALRENGKPVEMYVFPNETHAKWQPAHRLAVYRRNLDWFDFWLRRVENPDPAKADQYPRWRAMRKRLGQRSALY